MKHSILIAAAACLLLVGGCSQVRESLGGGKRPPDEFRVVSRAPLTVPPNFQLRPPSPGAPRPQEGTPTDQAKRAVFRADDDDKESVEQVIPSDGRSLGERALLKNANADEADSDIRLVLDRETDQINSESDTFIEGLIFWRDQPPAGEIINPEEENQRIREAEALGEPVTGEGTATIERRERGFLEGIF